MPGEMNVRLLRPRRNIGSMNQRQRTINFKVGQGLVAASVPTTATVFPFLCSPVYLSLLQQFCPTGPAEPVGPGGEPKTVAIAQCLAPHGYTQWSSYQPTSRFWMFQFIEAGWLVALSVLLLAATVWLVRRRAA